MNLPVRLLAFFLLLFAFVACRSAQEPAPSINAPETATAVSQRTEASPDQTPVPAAGEAGPVAAAYQDELSPALTMNAPRAAHTATLLPDGKVLLAGGFRPQGTAEIAIASAELYDPQTNSFMPTNDMNEPRSGHTATLLPNGKVLIVGGWGPNQRLATAELYDPAAGTFSYAASLFEPRASMTATLLQDGRVLIAGGDFARNSPQLVAEIYDPAANTFTLTGSLHDGRSAHTATRLADGTVLFAGGHSAGSAVLASAEIYDPQTGAFKPTGSMNRVRHKHAAVLLPDDTVLLIGGSNQDDWRGKYSSAELYDAQTGTFVEAASLNSERFKLADAAVLLQNGNVLVSGGHAQMELFDTRHERFLLSQRLDNHYYFAVMTVLQDGRVLITGGYDGDIQPTDQAWIYS